LLVLELVAIVEQFCSTRAVEDMDRSPQPGLRSR